MKETYIKYFRLYKDSINLSILETFFRNDKHSLIIVFYNNINNELNSHIVATLYADEDCKKPIDEDDLRYIETLLENSFRRVFENLDTIDLSFIDTVNIYNAHRKALSLIVM